jgi:hypothetical protein
MQRVGYDADTQTYTYRDQDGSFWEGDPGVRYGLLHRTGRSKFKQTLRTDTASINSNYLGESHPQPRARAKVEFGFNSDSSEEELSSPANGPHKQLFGLLSNGYGKLLLTLNLVYTGILKKVSDKKGQAQRSSKRHPHRHTQRRRRRPHKWNEK